MLIVRKERETRPEVDWDTLNPDLEGRIRVYQYLRDDFGLTLDEIRFICREGYELDNYSVEES